MGGSVKNCAYGVFWFLLVVCVFFDARTALCESGTDDSYEAEENVVYDDVVVTGTRSSHSLADVPVDTMLIPQEEIERSPAYNLPQLLRGVPGLSATNLDDTIGADNLHLTMRGLPLNHGYGLILVNGQRVHGGLGAHGDYGVSLNQVPLNMIDRVEIVKGASSALYGADAMAGVINIITKPVPETSGGMIGADYGVYDIMPQKGGTVKDSTRRRNKVYASFGSPVKQASGLLLHVSRDSDEGAGQYPSNTVRESAMARWRTDFDRNWSLDIGGDMSRGRRETGTNITEARYDREIDDYRVSSTLQFDSTAASWSLSGYSFSQDFVQGYPGFAHGYRYGDMGYDQAETVYTWYGQSHWLTMGVEAQQQGMDYTIENYTNGMLESTIPVKEDIDTYSVFLQDEIFLRDQTVTLVPGVRYEDHSTFGDEVNPKLALRIKSTRETTWRLSVGRAFKSPTIRQLYYDGTYLHGNRYMRSNPELSPEKAINYNISVERRPVDSEFWASIGVFRTDLTDKVVRYDTGEQADGIPVYSYQNIDDARIEGVEVSFGSDRDTGFMLRGSGAWTWAKDRQTDNDLPYVPEFTASLVPEYVTESGRTGTALFLIANGKQYRDAANDNEMGSHQVVDFNIWHKLTDNMTAALDFGNIFESHKGEARYAEREGRSVGLSVKGHF